MSRLSIRDIATLAILRRTQGLFRGMERLSRRVAVGRVERDLPFASRAGQALLLDAYVPAGEGPWPVVMMIHGGGFVMGDKMQLAYTCRRLAQAGFLTFCVNYRLAPEVTRDGQLRDCAVALEWVADHAPSYGGDLSRLCVGGGSAGGYLAASLGVYGQGGPSMPLGDPENRSLALACPIRAMLLLNGVFDFEVLRGSRFPRAKLFLRCFVGEGRELGGIGPSGLTREQLHAISPQRFVTDRFPPSFLGVGTEDSLFRASTSMAEVLKERGVPHELRTYPGSSHGWFNWSWTENAERLHLDAIAWLRATLGQTGALKPLPTLTASPEREHA